MSILDTRHEDRPQVAGDRELETVTTATTSASKATAAVSVREVTTAPTQSRLARFVTALRHSHFSARDRALLAEPAIYEEYRASLARHEVARELSRAVESTSPRGTSVVAVAVELALREERGLGAALETQLGQEIGHVVLHGLLREEHHLADLAVRESFGE